MLVIKQELQIAQTCGITFKGSHDEDLRIRLFGENLIRVSKKFFDFVFFSFSVFLPVIGAR
jgi:hypothetical protein